MDEKLNDIFSNINDWLKYAEAKSATLIAGNGALIWGIVRLSKTFEMNILFSFYLVMSASLCVASLVICLISVIPSLSMPWEAKPNGTKGSDNLLYFSDIAKYTPQAYLKALEVKLELKNSQYTGYQKDLSNQIIINSVIAKEKYRNFQIAVWLTLSAILSPIGAATIFILRKK
ncbi:MAG: Pycsar system effector family protein [Paraglaciecola sp.]|jgi:hypothetical protein|uniref:Pycsar system effector family protein n=1 Tax=Paraglaciecola sp. TaxID=1920173 RepID=UPI003299ACF7